MTILIPLNYGEKGAFLDIFHFSIDGNFYINCNNIESKPYSSLLRPYKTKEEAMEAYNAVILAVSDAKAKQCDSTSS